MRRGTKPKTEEAEVVETMTRSSRNAAARAKSAIATTLRTQVPSAAAAKSGAAIVAVAPTSGNKQAPLKSSAAVSAAAAVSTMRCIRAPTNKDAKNTTDKQGCESVANRVNSSIIGDHVFSVQTRSSRLKQQLPLAPPRVPSTSALPRPPAHDNRKQSTSADASEQCDECMPQASDESSNSCSSSSSSSNATGTNSSSRNVTSSGATVESSAPSQQPPPPPLAANTVLTAELKLTSIDAKRSEYTPLEQRFLCMNALQATALHVRKFISRMMRLDESLYEVVIMCHGFEVKSKCPLIFLKESFFADEESVILYFAIVERKFQVEKAIDDD